MFIADEHVTLNKYISTIIDELSLCFVDSDGGVSLLHEAWRPVGAEHTRTRGLLDNQQWMQWRSGYKGVDPYTGQCGHCGGSGLPLRCHGQFISLHTVATRVACRLQDTHTCTWTHQRTRAETCVGSVGRPHTCMSRRCKTVAINPTLNITINPT